MKGCMDNDPKCQNDTLRQVSSLCIAHSYRYVHSFENAAHAANDAFVKIFKNFKKFEIRDYAHVETMLLGWIKKDSFIKRSIDFMGRENLCQQNGTGANG
jgi:RNA polymerase sigma-70 factor (ECF subfamily)